MFEIRIVFYEFHNICHYNKKNYPLLYIVLQCAKVLVIFLILLCASLFKVRVGNFTCTCFEINLYLLIFL